MGNEKKKKRVKNIFIYLSAVGTTHGIARHFMYPTEMLYRTVYAERNLYRNKYNILLIRMYNGVHVARIHFINL